MNNDLISRSALWTDIMMLPHNGEIIWCDDVEQAIVDALAVDAEPVRHGRWIMRGGYFHCSKCDAKTLWKRNGGTGGFSYEFEQAQSNYCPSCGTKMDWKPPKSVT